MTKWEAGQDLIKIADLIATTKVDMRDQYPELYKMLDEVERTIGDSFNRLGSHSFGLRSHDEVKE